jgi:signal transduction histidine kinase/CheY-like chemotaxis protein
MAFCPAYSGAICSLCCSLDARCGDLCKPSANLGGQIAAPLRAALPRILVGPNIERGARYAMAFTLLSGAVALILAAIYSRTVTGTAMEAASLADAFRTTFLLLLPITAVGAWLLVLAQDSRRVANEERRRQTSLLLAEIDAHRRTDVQLQKAKEVAESANLAKSRYVVGISHELRSPLNAILGYAQLLERDGTIEARKRDSIGIIRRSGEHLAGLIDGLLDIAKIEAGRIELYRDAVHLVEFTEQLVNMFRLQAQAKGLDFLFMAPDRCPAVVYTDERRLRQILINLLSNAIKFTAQGSVSLRLAWRNQIAEFEIADTGIGIAPADAARIFEPFERVEQPRATNAPGIGLGLTITRLLTQIMGGELTLASVPGQGSRFVVRLMLSEAVHTRHAAPLEQRVQGFRGRRLTVLIADDDPVHRGLLQDLLSPLGFILFTVGNGPDCLAMAAQCRPDLLLVDISMPGLDGWQVAARLRANGFDTLVIIVISANAGALQGPPLEQPQHDDVLAKPIDIPLLLAKISKHLAIEWTAAEEFPPPAPATPVARGRLGRRHAEDLRELGAIGYVRGIHARLDLLEDELPDERDHIAQLRRLVSEFQLGEFMDALGPPRSVTARAV